MLHPIGGLDAEQLKSCLERFLYGVNKNKPRTTELVRSSVLDFKLYQANSDFVLRVAGPRSPCLEGKHWLDVGTGRTFRGNVCKDTNGIGKVKTSLNHSVSSSITFIYLKWLFSFHVLLELLENFRNLLLTY